MNLSLYVWLAVVAIVQLIAAAIEYNAIRNHVNGANGLFLFTAGVLSVGSLPVGGVIIWFLEGWHFALVGVALVGCSAALLFYGLLKALDRRARSAKQSG
jgi:hypothetical protein